MSKHHRILKLRPYQTRALRATVGHLNASPAALIVGPTGCGKTEMATAIIDRMPTARVLALADLADLANQNANRINHYLGAQRRVAHPHAGRVRCVVGEA